MIRFFAVSFQRGRFFGGMALLAACGTAPNTSTDSEADTDSGRSDAALADGAAVVDGEVVTPGDSGVMKDAVAQGEVGPPGPPGCGLANAAFCEDARGTPSPGGRSGELDPTRWSVSRMVSGDLNPNNLMSFPPTPVSACKSGISSVQPSLGLLLCDGASGHQGQILTAMSAQNYALMSMRPRQQFDFAGRTGTISFNVDAVTQGGLSWWTSIFITDQPDAGVNNAAQVMGQLPRNGIGFNFDNPCSNTGTGVDIFTYANYVETHAPGGSNTCFTSKRGSLNHIEIRMSQTNAEVWASDFSTDGGVTFPNLKRIATLATNLSFSRGYVHFQQAERAPVKYATEFSISPGYANNYWSKLGFDGPVISGENGYSVPDALTPNSNTGAAMVGYAIPSTGKTINIPNVKTAGVTSAELSFAVYYTFAGTQTTANAKLRYSLNGGAFLEPNPATNVAAQSVCSGCPGPSGGGGVNYSFPVPVGSLVNGTNTLAIKIDNSWDSYPPVLSSADLVTFGP